MNLIDAISTNTLVDSPVALSGIPVFNRQYGSLHDAVDNFLVPKSPDTAQQERIEHQQERIRIVSRYYPAPESRPFFLFGIDTTGCPRPYANTLGDRGIHYHPNPAPGNNPVAVGHAFSVVVGLPEKKEKNSPPWVIPLLIRRVSTDKKAIDVGAEQLSQIMNDQTLPFAGTLSVLSGDSTYSAREFLIAVVKNSNLVCITRARGNRTFYEKLPLLQSDYPKRRGHPTWYGKAFNMKAPLTWGNPDASEIVSTTFRNGRDCKVIIEAWHDMLMRDKRNAAMHEHPFTLLRITIKDSNENLVFKKALWLIIIGKRNREISLSEAYYAYRQRYDIEHFFRFGKNKLLMDAYQTPDIAHEENWWEIVGLSYTQLYIGAPLVQNHPQPWERYLPSVKEQKPGVLPSPSMVQRDLSRIIQEIGTPARLPKPRGKSPGRLKGQSPGKRDHLPIVKKKVQRSENEERSP